MKVTAVLLFAVFGVVAAQSVKNAEECKFCKFAFGVLEDKLGNNKTEAAVIAEMGKLCSDLPSMFQEKCKGLVIRYGAEVLKYIGQVTPTEFCDMIKVCATSAQLHAQPSTSEECKVCNALLSWMRSKISSHSTEADIERELNHFCDDLPTAIGGRCLTLVKDYTPVLVKMIKQDLSPTVVCQEMHLCPSSLHSRNRF